MPKNIAILQRNMVCDTRTTNNFTIVSIVSPAERLTAGLLANVILGMNAYAARVCVIGPAHFGLLTNHIYNQLRHPMGCLHRLSIKSSQTFILDNFFRTPPISLARRQIFLLNPFRNRCLCIWDHRVPCSRHPASNDSAHLQRHVSSYRRSSSVSTHC